ncbi:MAG: DsbA family protein [Clostridium sp.]|jgi:predicted DsbA family dithiol-disulfide isomerase|nr:DsbA family protein [Clostridium sp.]
MIRLEVFFDYACPYCLEGHQNLRDLLPDYPQIEVVWRPCEAHPRPERYGPHSDLCIQGMFCAAEQGADLWTYHERAYELILKRHVDVENIDVLAQCFFDLPDAGAFREALRSGRYRQVQQDANRYAYEKSGVWAVPAYRLGAKKLDAVENIGVTKAQLRAFLETGSEE